MSLDNSGRTRRAGIAALGAAAIGGALWAALSFGGSVAANAQTPAAQEFDPAIVARGLSVFRDKVNCASCHGWAGNGVPDDPRQPVGANLRATQLTHDQLVMIVRCGIPGTGMPYFDRLAYTDGRCYGLTPAQLGANMPQASEVTLINRELDALATYIEATLKGRGQFTLDECEAYHGVGADFCRVLMLNPAATVPGAGAAGAHG
jgi:mono/diheme cytochrome c family protein